MWYGGNNKRTLTNTIVTWIITSYLQYFIFLLQCNNLTPIPMHQPQVLPMHPYWSIKDLPWKGYKFERGMPIKWVVFRPSRCPLRWVEKNNTTTTPLNTIHMQTNAFIILIHKRLLQIQKAMRKYMLCFFRKIKIWHFFVN